MRLNIIIVQRLLYFAGLAMDPPKLENIATTILQLKLLGALQSFDGEDGNQIDGRMTFLGNIYYFDFVLIVLYFYGRIFVFISGHIMADLPISIMASRLIALGYCFSVLDECIIIG